MQLKVARSQSVVNEIKRFDSKIVLINFHLDFDGLDQRVKIQSLKLHLIRCLTDSLSDSCVDFRPEQYCNKLKRFMSKCPGIKPNRHNSISVSATLSVSGRLV